MRHISDHVFPEDNIAIGEGLPTNVQETNSIAETPKDGLWYRIPCNKYGHFIKWNDGSGAWQSMVLDENGTLKFHELMADGEEIVTNG